MPPTVDMDKLTRLSLQIEATLHRQGWDGNPMVYVLYDGSDTDCDQRFRNIAVNYGPAIRREYYAAQPFALPGELNENPNHKIFAMAQAMVAGDAYVGQLVRILQELPAIFGVAFVCEGWTTIADADDEAEVAKFREVLRRHQQEGVSLKDVPTSKEVRMVTAATFDDRAVTVLRVRGSKPEARAGTIVYGDIDALGVEKREKSTSRGTGAVVEALGLLAHVVTGTRPYPTMHNTPQRWGQ